MALSAVLGGVGDDADPMAERIVEAAFGQLLDAGVRHFSVEDVARRAGINRITIYRRFAGKDDLLLAVILREGRRLFEQIDGAVASIGAPDEQIVEGFAASLMAVRDHPLVQRLLASEPEMVASLLVSHGAAIVALAREYLASHARRAQEAGRLGEFDASVIAELAVRLSLSLVLTPESCIRLDSADDARRFAREYLLPAIGVATEPTKVPIP